MTGQTVEVKVEFDRTSQSQLAKKAPELETLLVMHVTDEPSHILAGTRILAARAWLKAVDAIMDPVRDATHKAWKAAIKAQDDFKAPVALRLKVLEAADTKFVLDAEEETAQRQRIKDEQQRKENEANAREAAKDLKRMGASKEMIASVKEEIKARPAEVVAPVAVAAEEQTLKTYYGVEVLELKTLLNFLVTNERLMILLSMDKTFIKQTEVALGSEARAMKDRYDIPGTRLVKSVSSSWRA